MKVTLDSRMQDACLTFKPEAWKSKTGMWFIRIEKGTRVIKVKSVLELITKLYQSVGMLAFWPKTTCDFFRFSHWEYCSQRKIELNTISED
jgi:hypothetical protein